MDQQQGILHQHSALGPIPLPPGTPPVPLLSTSLGSITPASLSTSSNTSPSKTISNSSTSLEMKLHRLQFVEILKKGCGNNRLEAIQYARRHFPRFVNGHEKDIATLMGALMYAGPKLGKWQGSIMGRAYIKVFYKDLYHPQFSFYISLLQRSHRMRIY